MVARQRLDPLDDALRIEIAGAAVDADGQRTAAAAAALAERRREQMLEQRQGQIVHHLPADILERPERRRLAGARQAGDEEEALGRGAGFQWSGSPKRRSACSSLTGAEASSGASAIAGSAVPSSATCFAASGSRSGASSSSATRQSGTSDSAGNSMMPTPRISSLPA